MVNFSYNQQEKMLIWTLHGRIDTFACGNLSDMILGKLTAMKGTDDPAVLLEEKIIFDLKDVEFISSAFFRICMSASRHIPQGHFSIVNCSPFLKKTFSTAGLDEVLNVS